MKYKNTICHIKLDCRGIASNAPSVLLNSLIICCIIIFPCLTTNANHINVCDSLVPTPLSETPAGLKILSWNIGMLPVLGVIKKNNKRASAIANALFYCDYDIIVFQEAFTSAARNIINHKLHDLYPYAYGPVNSSKLSLKFNGGVWILSKIPLVKIKEIKFSASAGFDKCAKKGAFLFTGQFHNSFFQLIATHLEDDEYPQSIREKQLKEIYEKLILPYSEENHPQIICGDFNTDQMIVANYKGLLNKLNAQDGEISGKMKITFDDESNDVYKSKHPHPRRIDYILIRNPHIIKWISRKITVLKNRWGKGYEYLSDHNAIEAFIQFKNMDFLSKSY